MTSLNSITTGIVDNDPRGLSTRGTKFWLEIVLNGVKTRHEYFLLDLLEKKFDLDAVLAEVRKQMDASRQQQEEVAAQAKKDELAKRAESVSCPPELQEIIHAVVANNAKAVSEYRSGKDKALNSLVGLVIKESKSRRLETIDAFTITTLLKKSLT